MLISGPSNCGKTNTLMHILREPLVYYDKCYIYTSNPQQDKIQDFIKLMERIGQKIGYNPLEIRYEDDIREVKDYPQNNINFEKTKDNSFIEQFSIVSKVIWDRIGFALLRSVIGLENSRHPLNQSDAKLKPIATWSLAFSRA